jgi:hypothetical protein
MTKYFENIVEISTPKSYIFLFLVSRNIELMVFVGMALMVPSPSYRKRHYIPYTNSSHKNQNGGCM